MRPHLDNHRHRLQPERRELEILVAGLGQGPTWKSKSPSLPAEEPLPKGQGQQDTGKGGTAGKRGAEAAVMLVNILPALSGVALGGLGELDTPTPIAT